MVYVIYAADNNYVRYNVTRMFICIRDARSAARTPVLARRGRQCHVRVRTGEAVNLKIGKFHMNRKFGKYFFLVLTRFQL